MLRNGHTQDSALPVLARETANEALLERNARVVRFARKIVNRLHIREGVDGAHRIGGWWDCPHEYCQAARELFEPTHTVRLTSLNGALLLGRTPAERTDD